jgi:hypothetical protein
MQSFVGSRICSSESKFAAWCYCETIRVTLSCGQCVEQEVKMVRQTNVGKDKLDDAIKL